jgi:hypothetical protein
MTCFALAPRPVQRCGLALEKVLAICELPHTQTAKSAPVLAAHCAVEEMQMAGWIIAAMVAIGLMWSVATMSNLVPVVG